MKQKLRLMLLVCTLLGLPTVALGQPGGEDRQRGPSSGRGGEGGESRRFGPGGPGASGGRGEWSGRGGDRGSWGRRGEGGGDSQRGPGSSNSGSSSGDWLTRLDTNKNGMLDPDEAKAVSPTMKRLLERRKLDLSKPVSLETIRGGSSNSSSSSSDRSSSSSSKTSSSTSSAPAVQGFGSSQPSTVPGFGPPAAGSSGSGSRSDRGSSDRGGDGDRRFGGGPGRGGDGDSDRGRGDRGGDDRRGRSGGGPGGPGDGDRGSDERMARFAEAIMRQNDKNRSGSLEKDEWGGLRDPNQTDADGNGVITKEEISQQLANFSRGQRPRYSGPSSSRSDSGSRSRSSDSSGDTVALRRFRTAIERLPEGLPSWFRDADTDQDGQVMMHEYASSWTQARADEFDELDLNGDGVITPKEAKSASR